MRDTDGADEKEIDCGTLVGRKSDSRTYGNLANCCLLVQNGKHMTARLTATLTSGTLYRSLLHAVNKARKTLVYPRLFASCCALLLLLQLQFVGAANAAGQNIQLQTCLDMQGKETSENELDCYRQAAQTPDLTARPFMSPRAHGLAKEWAPSSAPFIAYKQNYALLYSRSSQTNNAPTSPNPLNQVLTPTVWDNRDLKFQISLKHDLLDFQQYGSLWFGYTQLSFWQFYDSANSRPLRENNYEPEFIYSLRSRDLVPSLGPSPSILNFGIVHQSNGQPNPRSREWNRIYIQPGLEVNADEGRRLVLLLRLWKRIKVDAATDGNPDITHFLGHGDIEVRYSRDKNWEISAIARARSIQLDWAVPWPFWLTFPASFGEHNTNVHVQYFSGYGESLTDYNHKHHTWGVGLTFPFD